LLGRSPDEKSSSVDRQTSGKGSTVVKIDRLKGEKVLSQWAKQLDWRKD